jgi:hypothetical protein
VYKLAAKFQSVVATRPGQRLEKLVEILRPEGLRASTRQDRPLVLDAKARKRRLQNGSDISTKPFRISDYAVVHNSKFRRQARRPGTNEVEGNILVAGRDGHVQPIRIGLTDSCEHVLVFKSIAGKGLHL